MTKTVWDDLPNAKHIDRILAHFKANLAKWHTAKSVTYDEAWSAVYDATYNAAYNAARKAAYDAAWEAAKHNLGIKS